MLSLVVALAGCSQLAALVRPGINANAQLGKENTQQVVAKQDNQVMTQDVDVGDGSTSEVVSNKDNTGITAEKVEKANTTKVTTKKQIITNTNAEKVDTVRTSDKAQEVHTGDNSNVIVNQTEQVPWWVMALLVLGWILPTPYTMGVWFVGLFKKKDN